MKSSGKDVAERVGDEGVGAIRKDHRHPWRTCVQQLYGTPRRRQLYSHASPTSSETD